MRFIIVLVCSLFVANFVFAQKKNITSKTVKLPNTIDRSDKRKVEKAKKLLNNGQLFEGEKILVKLRNENMNHAYFHEALIQVQKQILDRIAMQHPPSDDDGEYFLYGSENLKPGTSLEENYIDNGLARSVEDQEETVSNIRLSRKGRKVLKKALKESEKYESYDSVKNPIDAAQEEINKINQTQKRHEAQKAEQSKLDRKKAKVEDDLFLIPYSSYAFEIISNCRFATLKHERVDSASHYLRMLLIDTVVYDSLLTTIELETMQDALDLYYTHDYHRATNKFELITDVHPDYFPAHLYLANTYFQIGLDTPAFKQYVYVTQTFSERPEGFEGLAHYYLEKGKYKDAAACILKAILIYPEDAYFAYLDRIMKRMGKTLSSQWVRREVYPLKTDKNYEDIIATEKSPWRYYQSAKSDLFSYAGIDGILRGNEITAERYLELYAWQEMLADHKIIDTVIKDPKLLAEYLSKQNQKSKTDSTERTDFPFARSMQKMGYLDCYVFISLFHHDLYPAFKDFVILHPDKVEEYFYILLNWEDEKFDKFRIKEKSHVRKSAKKEKEKLGDKKK